MNNFISTISDCIANNTLFYKYFCCLFSCIDWKIWLPIFFSLLSIIITFYFQNLQYKISLYNKRFDAYTFIITFMNDWKNDFDYIDLVFKDKQIDAEKYAILLFLNYIWKYDSAKRNGILKKRLNMALMLSMMMMRYAQFGQR